MQGKLEKDKTMMHQLSSKHTQECGGSSVKTKLCCLHSSNLVLLNGASGENYNIVQKQGLEN